MDKTNKILLSIAIVAAIAAAIYLLAPADQENLAEVNNNAAGDNIELNDQEIVNGNEIEVEGTTYTESDRAVFETYINENISMLSQEPEVLGGTFAVTSYTWIDNNTAILAYEDGHNAYQAETKLSYDANSNVVVDYFYTMILENEEEAGEPVVDENPVLDQEINEEFEAEVLMEESLLVE